MRWWERDGASGRDRYAREIEALERAGYDPRPEPDPALGRVRVALTVPVNGQPAPLEIIYHATYPWFRFDVRAPAQLGFRRHQHPVSGALCLIDQGTGNWDPTELAADVIARQLKKLEEANATDGPYANEAQTPEPISMYFECQSNSLIVMPPEAYAIPAEQNEGRLHIVLAKGGAMRGYVDAIDGRAVRLPDLSLSLPGANRVSVDWLRVPAPTRVVPDQIAEDLYRSGRLRRPRPVAPGLDYDLTALLFEEEVEYRDVMGPGWAFLLRTRRKGGWHHELLRVERYDAEELSARIPEIKGLSERTVFQAGAGGLGGPAAHLLAQSRLGRLRLTDPDVVGLGNGVRWPLGLVVAGVPKVRALAAFLMAHYPDTKIQPLEWAVGHTYELDEEAVVDEVLEGVDLVFDATAEVGVQQFLAVEARARGLPFVQVEARPGGFGGLVVVLRPGADDACWRCLKLAIDDGKFRPPYDEAAGTLQLAGCSSASFTGAAFDLVPLAALAVRVIAQLLTTEAEPAWTVAVLSNREDDQGTVGSTPRWTFHALAADPRCGRHAAAA